MAYRWIPTKPRAALLAGLLVALLSPAGTAHAGPVHPSAVMASAWSPGAPLADAPQLAIPSWQAQAPSLALPDTGGATAAERLFSVPNVAVVLLGMAWLLLMRRRRQ